MDAEYYLDISENIDDSFGNKLLRVLHSTILYVIAYAIVTYFQQAVTGGVAWLMGYQPSIQYFGIYHMPVSPSQWTKWSILFIYGSGPVSGLIIGFIAYRINAAIREFNTLWKDLALWVAVHGSCLFFSYCITGAFGTGNYYVPFYYGFAVIASWLRIDTVLMAPLTLFGIVSLIVFGLNTVVPFLSLCFSRRVAINFRARRGFLAQVSFFPWILGTVICVLMSLPPNHSPRDIIINLARNGSLAFIMLGMWFKMDHIVGSIQVHSFDIFRRKPWVSLFVLALLIIIIQHRELLWLLHITNSTDY